MKNFFITYKVYIVNAAYILHALFSAHHVVSGEGMHFVKESAAHESFKVGEEIKKPTNEQEARELEERLKASKERGEELLKK